MSQADEVRRLLQENEAARRQADEHEARIKRASEDELGRIDSRLMTLPHGQVAGDSAAAYEYRRLQDDRASLLRQVANFS
jgi:hypothetical protein